MLGLACQAQAPAQAVAVHADAQAVAQDAVPSGAPQSGRDAPGTVGAQQPEPNLEQDLEQDRGARDGANDPQDPALVGAADPSQWTPVEAIDGVPVITQRYYFPSGKLRRIHTQLPETEGPFGHHGRDLHLHENGAFHKELHWQEGRLHGPFGQWYEGGQNHIRAQYANGLRTGEYQEWGDLGVRRVLAHYANGKLHGEFRLWHIGGARQEHSEWIHGVQTGTHAVWSISGAPVFEHHYERGVLEGPWTDYHKNTTEALVSERGTMRAGERTGLWEQFDTQGRLVAKKTYAKGILNGPFEQWQQGALVLKTHYQEGLEEGARQEFYLGGEKFAEGRMTRGLRTGVWSYYSESGALDPKFSGTYEQGKKVAEHPTLSTQAPGGDESEAGSDQDSDQGSDADSDPQSLERGEDQARAKDSGKAQSARSGLPNPGGATCA